MYFFTEVADRRLVHAKKSSRIFGYISFGVVLYAALNHLEYVIMVGRNAVHLVSPLITGLVLAFVLHVPVNLLTSRLERLFEKTKRKPSHKTIEGISLLLTFILIALIVTLAFTMIAKLRAWNRF